jgi:Tol biopolymer transport system component
MTLTPERWQRARDVLHEAMQMEEDDRSAFLDSQCATDPSLRIELKELLAAEGEVDSSFLEEPAIAHAAAVNGTSEQTMMLPAGTRLGPYQVQSLIGAGGMGEVYRARDTSLKRDVAIKVLPASFSRDPDRLRRFQLEAEAAAALNHPNILSIFAIGQQDGSPYIVTELLEGETLRERLRHGALKLRDAIDIAIQAAKGLAAAHEKGIAHRDLKPENLFLAKDGRVKILDFGLAKLMQSPSSSDDPTLSLREQTDIGRVLGTVGYMSPEQVRGQSADARSDIFALGCVLYETLTGKRAFRKPSSIETMHAILNEDPQAASDITRTIPPALERVVHRCLEKSPDRRFQSASDLAFALDALSGSGVSEPTGPKTQKLVMSGNRRVAITAALLLFLAIPFAAYLSMRPEPVPRVSNYVRLSHDGQPKQLLGADGSRLYLLLTKHEYIGATTATAIAEMSVSGGELQQVPNLLPRNLTVLSLSPDGSQLLEVESQDNTGSGPLWSVPTLAGSARRLGDTKGGTGTWSPDGKKLAYTNLGSLFVANADGSESHKILELPAPEYAFFPVWSPDQTHLRFLRQKGFDLFASHYWEVSLDGSGLRHLLPWEDTPQNTQCCGRWTPDGKYFIFLSGNQIWTLPRPGLFDRKTNPTQTTTSPLPVGDPIPSADGKKIFFVSRAILGHLERFDSRSHEFVPFLDGISAEFTSFSPDDQWVAYTLFPQGTLWRSRVDGSEKLQLTFPPIYAVLPRWSPDGRQIVFSDGGVANAEKIYMVSAQGGSPTKLLPADTLPQLDPNWSADGNKILFGETSNNPNSLIRVLDLPSHQVSTIPGSKGLFSPRWSPDGRWISAHSADQARMLLFDVRSQRWTELTGSGFGWPEWSKDSRYIYCFGAGSVVRIRVSDGAIEKIADLAKFSTTGYMGSWSSITPDNSPLLLRNIGTEDVYSLDWQAP